MHLETYTDKPIAVNGRVLLELHDGKVTIYPITNSDEETRILLAAILDHVVEAIRRDKKQTGGCAL